MNLSTFYRVIEVLNRDMQKSQIAQKIGAIQSGLQSVVNNPQANYQATVAQNLPALYEALEKTEVNDFSPAWRQVLNDLNCGDIVGANLAIQVRGIFERNQITQQIALAEINELNSRIANLTSSINQIMASMKTMKWHEHLEQVAECEIGFMIPRAVINNDIDMLSKELHEMKFIFNTFSEFVTGETTKFDLVTLSTSDPLVTVSTILKIGSAFGKAVSWLIDSYKKLIEIRKSLEELKSKGVP